MVEFPFALLSDRQREGDATVCFSDHIRGPDGQPVSRTWTVTGADEFGLPTATDELVYLVLGELTREQGFTTPKIHVSRYDLVRRLGWPDKGGSYTRLRRALDRLLGVTITASRAFYDRTARTYVDVGFHILDDYAIFDEPRGRKARASDPPRSYIRWSKTIFASFLAGYCKRLDLGIYLSLRSAVSRRLYRYLDKKRYDGKAQFRIGLAKLAFEKLGMSRTYYPSHIRAELARAHEELMGLGFLRGVAYEVSSATAEPLVVYRFGRSRQPTATHEEMARRLVALGVAEPVAVELALTDPEGVEEQLAHLPYREPRDPAAMLVAAIREGWPAPAKAPARQPDPAPAEPAAPNLGTALEAGAAAQTADPLAALSEARRAELEAVATRQIEADNPRVARYPGSAAYRALLRDRMARLLAGSGGEAAPRS